MTTRGDIAEALGKLDYLAPSLAMPDTIVAGSAWPAWSSTTWVNACATAVEWYVFVAIPNAAIGATADAGDAVVDEVATVLWPLGKVVRVEPWRIAVEPGQQTTPVVRFTLQTN